MNPNIKTWEDRNTVMMRCNFCGALATIETKDCKKAYLAINLFRGKHEHLYKADTLSEKEYEELP